MTEKEFVREMLCSIPISYLVERLGGSSNIPNWLTDTPDESVIDAINHYYDNKFVEMRKYEATLF